MVFLDNEVLRTEPLDWPSLRIENQHVRDDHVRIDSDYVFVLRLALALLAESFDLLAGEIDAVTKTLQTRPHVAFQLRRNTHRYVHVCVIGFNYPRRIE